jgi:hypothetical protein
MAHFLKPPGADGAGYDVDGKLAPGSVWRMQIPSGQSRGIAIWGANGLWARSNNPPVVPNDGFKARTLGDLRILTLVGASPGTSMLEVGDGPKAWISLQVQVVGAASSTTAAQLVWMGVRLYRLPDDAIASFVAGLLDGVADQLQDQNVCDRLRVTITGDPLGFYWGYSLGVLTGLKAGLVNLVGTIVDLFKLAAELAPTAAFALTNPSAFLAHWAASAVLELTDRSKRELKLRQLEQVKRIGAAAKDAIEDIATNPDDYINFSGQVGAALGANARVWFTENLVEVPAKQLGETVGSVVGQVLFEILLEVALAAATGGAGNVAEAGVAAGQGARGAGRLAGLIESLRPLVSKIPGLERVLARLRGARQALRTDAAISAAVEAAFAEGAQFEVGVMRVIRVSEPGAVLTAEQLSAWRGLKGAGGLPEEFAQVWRSCSNKAAEDALAEVRRLWALGEDASKLEARRLARVTYNNWRNRFMGRLRQPANSALRSQIERAGFRFPEGRTTVPRLAKGTEDVLTLDHTRRLMENPARCVDPTNLEFVIGYENSVTLEQLRNFTSTDLF